MLDTSPASPTGREITHILGVPALLEEMLKALPAGYAARRPVLVTAVGVWRATQCGRQSPAS